jgi:hypothetical protein
MYNITTQIVLCICFVDFSDAATVSQFDEESAKNYLENVVKTYDIKDVAEVLNECKPNVEEYLSDSPRPFMHRYFKDRLNYFIQNTAPTIEGYLDLQYKTISIGSFAVTVDRNWEEAFQVAATSQLLLPKEFKHPITINKYLSFLRGIYPLFEEWFRRNLYYILPAEDVITVADNYRVYELIRDYYRAGKPPLSIVLAIKAAEDQKKREAEEWHFSDVLHWFPFGSRAPSTASSAPSSNEGTPPNGSFRAIPQPDQKSAEQIPLLAAEEHKADGLRKRR